ncbi:hypothetical protein ABZV14_05580 [Streptosporangium canum]|uniref:hypothetical protein n=1 Tax=Streptosporangium canum TaxID=324952 RepID=UPI0033B20FB9
MIRNLGDFGSVDRTSTPATRYGSLQRGYGLPPDHDAVLPGVLGAIPPAWLTATSTD